MNYFPAARFGVLLVLLWIETITVLQFVHCNGDIGISYVITWNDLKMDSTSYVTRKDLKMDIRRLSSKSGGYGDRQIVVDKNGGGDSLTVQDAVDMVPENNAGRVKIHIRPGVYSEKVHIPESKPFISFIGDPNRASGTVITWHDKASDRDNNGYILGTAGTASVTVQADYFCAAGITFQNTIVNPPGGTQGNQAVALRIAGDKAVFYKVRFLGSQDTLLDESRTHYYLQCFIQGSVDFIFGNARSLYQECSLSVVGNAYAITAQSRGSSDENTGFSFVDCTVSGSSTGNVDPVYLGRAWGDYSRVIFSNTQFDLDVIPQGWNDWGVPSRQNTVSYGEYNCRGRGADRSGRVGWSKALNDMEAKPYLDISFLDGDQWLRL